MKKTAKNNSAVKREPNPIPKMLARVYEKMENSISQQHGLYRVYGLLNSLRGKRWVLVETCTPALNKAYVIRQAHGCGVQDEPCLALWTKNGWQALEGHLGSGAGFRKVQIWK